MDAVAEIKSRLSIEDLVRRYCALTKKGRNYVALCPFHNDTHPSMLVSPDKGIAYCFPCQKGGDIFSFYQAVEGVEFVQALKDLAEMTGVTLQDAPSPKHRDERERLRSCLESALALYRRTLADTASAREYLQKRGVTDGEFERFELGLAPASFSATYEMLLKEGFSRSEVVAAGLAIQRDLREGKMFDRFRSRIMFPIRDVQSRLIGFGGRALDNDEAKYMNTTESPLYHKSRVLFGLPQAREAMRAARKVIVVEGYFDVLACHRIGLENCVATCGTALTEEHAKFLRRYVDTVTLCLDQDRAGREAAERAFGVLSKEGLVVEGVILADKDPADAVLADADVLKNVLMEGARPYLDLVLDELRVLDLRQPRTRREALERILKLLQSVESAVERTHYVRQAAIVFATTESALEDDLERVRRRDAGPITPSGASASTSAPTMFSATELALGLLLLYPSRRHLLEELIPPEEGIAPVLYAALKAAGDGDVDVETLELAQDARERIQILRLYCEQHGFLEWGESIAVREIRRNCQNANREYLRRKQHDLTQRLLLAQREGRTTDEDELRAQFTSLLKLSKLAG